MNDGLETFDLKIEDSTSGYAPRCSTGVVSKFFTHPGDQGRRSDATHVHAVPFLIISPYADPTGFTHRPLH